LEQRVVFVYILLTAARAKEATTENQNAYRAILNFLEAATSEPR
jgi:hypothetical protein